MKTIFPTIHNISDVLPAIENRPEFVVMYKDHATVIDYVYADADTFNPNSYSDPNHFLIALECRGIAFDKETGDIISRPYHKFFNLNEKEFTQEGLINFHLDHVILDKLDGSMIRPMPVYFDEIDHSILIDDDHVENGITFIPATRAGITDVSLNAHKYLCEIKSRFIRYYHFFREMHRMGLTPIFEFCSSNPENRIVIKHDRTQLILTAVRDIQTGKYATFSLLRQLSEKYNIPRVLISTFGKEFADIKRDALLSAKNYEGIVIRFFDGGMLKLKCDEYCNLHRAMSYIRSEKFVSSNVIMGSTDDLISKLPDEYAEAVKKYSEDFWECIENYARQIRKVFFYCKYIDGGKEVRTGRDFAEYLKININKAHHGLLYRLSRRVEKENLSENGLLSAIIEYITEDMKKTVGNNAGLDKYRHIITIDYNDYI